MCLGLNSWHVLYVLYYIMLVSTYREIQFDLKSVSFICINLICMVYIYMASEIVFLVLAESVQISFIISHCSVCFHIKAK